MTVKPLRADHYYAWWSIDAVEDFSHLLMQKINRDLKERGVLVQAKHVWPGIHPTHVCLDVIVDHSNRCPCEDCKCPR